MNHQDDCTTNACTDECPHWPGDGSLSRESAIEMLTGSGADAYQSLTEFFQIEDGEIDFARKVLETGGRAWVFVGVVHAPANVDQAAVEEVVERLIDAPRADVDFEYLSNPVEIERDTGNYAFRALGREHEAEIKAALEGESNDAEHDALASVAEALGIDWLPDDVFST